jgi:hypothetical protein
MRLQELRPRRLLHALGRGLHAGLTEEAPRSEGADMVRATTDPADTFQRPAGAQPKTGPTISVILLRGMRKSTEITCSCGEE